MVPSGVHLGCNCLPRSEGCTSEGLDSNVNKNAQATELAQYSTFGAQVVAAGETTPVTPFGFQGNYADSTGLLYMFNRFYDPLSAQFLSVDPALASTQQPYSLDGSNSLNASDPLGNYTGCIGPNCGIGSGWIGMNGHLTCAANCGGSWRPGDGPEIDYAYQEQMQAY